MPCPHFDIRIQQRSKGQSAVAGSAYQSCSKIFSQYDQRTKNYEYKRHELVFEKVLLPEQALEAFKDRAKLWNSVELSEKSWNAQLARRIIVALPKELTIEQNISLIQEYCQENFVAKGMCCDLAIHNPRPPGHNLHAHIMLTMRALDDQGHWLPKSKKVYDLDERGNQIRLPSGRWKSHKVSLTDWDQRSNCELWRHNWEVKQNEYLERFQHPERVSLKSFSRQGIPDAPTIHLGPAITALERKGIRTDLGNLNREIREHNRILHELGSIIAKLKAVIKKLQEKSKEFPEEKHDKPTRKESGSLYDRLVENAYRRQDERAGWSFKARINGSMKDAETVEMLRDFMAKKKIYTVSDLNAHIHDRIQEIRSIHKKLHQCEARIYEIKAIRAAVLERREALAIYEEYKKLPSGPRRNAFYEANKKELNHYYHAMHVLKEKLPDGKYDAQKLSEEYEHLLGTANNLRAELTETGKDLKMLRKLEWFAGVDSVENRKSVRKKLQNMENTKAVGPASSLVAQHERTAFDRKITYKSRPAL